MFKLCDYTQKPLLRFLQTFFIISVFIFLSSAISFSTQYEYFSGNILVKGQICSDWVPKIAFSVATEASNNIAVTVTVTNTGATTIAKNCSLRLWLSDTAGGAATATAPDGSGTAANGWITSDATEFQEVTGEIQYYLLTGSDGDATITFKDDDADNDWYLCGELDGVVYYSAVISHTL